MSEHLPEIVTDIGLPVPKPFGKNRSGRPSIDVEDFDALRAAAHCLSRATPRELMSLSLIEQRALFKLAAVGADVIWLASAAVAASDSGAPRTEIIARQEKLADYVRPYIGREP
jgi:hypothetical protein